jgi:hypothetical protein
MQFITKTLEENLRFSSAKADHLSTFIADLKVTIHAKKGTTLKV